MDPPTRSLLWKNNAAHKRDDGNRGTQKVNCAYGVSHLIRPPWDNLLSTLHLQWLLSNNLQWLGNSMCLESWLYCNLRHRKGLSNSLLHRDHVHEWNKCCCCWCRCCRWWRRLLDRSDGAFVHWRLLLWCWAAQDKPNNANQGCQHTKSDEKTPWPPETALWCSQRHGQSPDHNSGRCGGDCWCPKRQLWNVALV